MSEWTVKKTINPTSYDTMTLNTGEHELTIPASIENEKLFYQFLAEHTALEKVKVELEDIVKSQLK